MRHLLLALCLLLPFDSAPGAANLLLNGGAEAASLFGWTRGQGVFTVVDSVGFQVYGGAYAFWAGGGPLRPKTSDMYQDVDVSTFGTCIDGAGCSWDFLGGSLTITSSGDSARFVVEFRIQTNGDLLGRYDSGQYVTGGSWMPIEASGLVPANTRSIRVHVYGKDPQDNQEAIGVFFDSMSLSVSPGSPSLPRTWGEVKANYR